MAKPSPTRPVAHASADHARQRALAQRAIPLLRAIGEAMSQRRVPARELRLLGELVAREYGPTAQAAAGTSSGTAAAAAGPAAGDDALPDPGDDPDAPRGAGTAAQPSPAEASSASTTPARPQRGEAHLWIPRGLDNAALLLALVLDGPAGWPDNATATAGLLGVTREAVRQWRAALVLDGMVRAEGGRLVATDAGRACLVRSDPLPRCLLGRTTPSQTRACATVYGETIGWRADRRGVRNDSERAEGLRIGRATIAEARKVLVARGMVTLESAQRGRARLMRARALLDANGKPVGSHGRPMGEDRRQRLAVAAERGRRGANGSSRVGANRSSTPIQSLRGTLPMQGAKPAEPNGSEIASLRDGLPAAEPTRKRITATAAQVLDELVPTLPAAKADRAAKTEATAEAAAVELRRLAADPGTLPKLLRMTPPRAIAQVLAAARVFDRAPKRLAGLSVQIARVLGVVQVVALALDVVLGRPRNVGVVLLGRLKRATSGEGELLTRCRAKWPIGRFLVAVAAQDAEAGALRAVAPTPTGFSPAAEAHAQDDERALMGHAVAGSWRMVAHMLGRSIARERGWSVGWLSDRSGVPEKDIEAGLAAAREKARATFEARRATA